MMKSAISTETALLLHFFQQILQGDALKEFVDHFV